VRELKRVLGEWHVFAVAGAGSRPMHEFLAALDERERRGPQASNVRATT
jgi:hypothetical protein